MQTVTRCILVPRAIRTDKWRRPEALRGTGSSNQFSCRNGNVSAPWDRDSLLASARRTAPVGRAAAVEGSPARLGTAIALQHGMESRTQWLGHPVHQMLVVFPLGALALSRAGCARAGT